MKDSDAPKFSRSGFTSPIGKFTAEFPKWKGPEETKEILEREARRAGMGLAEFIRELCMIRAHGKDVVRSLYAQRLDVVDGTGKENGRSRP